MPRYSEYDSTLEETLGIGGRGVASNQVNRRIEKAMLGVLNATSDDGWDIVFRAAALEEDDLAGMSDEDVEADLAAHEGKKKLTRAAEAQEWQELREQIDASRQRVLKMQSDAAEAAEQEAQRREQEAAAAPPPGFGKSDKGKALHASRRKKKFADAVALEQIQEHTRDEDARSEDLHLSSEPLQAEESAGRAAGSEGETELPPLA